MNCEVVDLYGFYDIERRGSEGGYLTVYARAESAEMKRRVRPAMLVIAGGGYGFISDREGEPVALKFLGEGFASFVLKYSVKTKYPAPLIEAMLAAAYIRDNAESFCVDKNKVCAIGFSAGGHLAGLLSTVKEEEAALIGKTSAQVKPDAVILAYPVVTMGGFTHSDTRRNISGGEASLYAKLSVEKRADGGSAPAFIWHTFEDNCVPVENSLMLAEAYRRAGVPFALHIFEHGWHGFSLADRETCEFPAGQAYLYDVGKWVGLSLDWLKARGFHI